MKYIRLKVVSTDADTGGVANNGLSTAYIKYAASNTLESNKPIVAAYAGQAVDGSIGGLGADPS